MIAFSIGLPELLVIAFWLTPLIAFVWAVKTLSRIARTQDKILERLEQLLRSEELDQE